MRNMSADIVSQTDQPFIYERDMRITSAYCGNSTETDVCHVMELMQDCFTEYLSLLHCDNIRLHREFRRYWVVMRAYCRFGTAAQWNETIHARTSVIKRTPMIFETEIVLTHSDGSLVADGVQQLCVLDMAEHKPCKLDFLPELTSFPCAAPLGEAHRFLRLVPPQVALSYETVIRATDVDSNGHMNNIAYVRAVLNAFSVKELKTTPIASLEMHYDGECFENETLVVSRADDEKKSCVMARTEHGGATAFILFS